MEKRENFGRYIKEKRKAAGLSQKELATQLSAEGSVLLKNDGALPVKKDSENITLWGLNSINPTLGGMIGSSVAVDEENGQTAYSLQQEACPFSLKLRRKCVPVQPLTVH